MKNKLTSASLWESLERYEFDTAGSAMPFSKRLAQENHWSHGYAARVIREYKRFAFLAMCAGHRVTPPDQVDQAWHLHLIYTEEYWGNFCPHILGAPLHHGPTAGGKAEEDKFNDWYSRTKKSYRSFFGAEPPSDIWPENAERFGREFKRIDMCEHIVIKKGDYPLVSKLIGAILNLVKKLTTRKNRQNRRHSYEKNTAVSPVVGGLSDDGTHLRGAGIP